VEQYCNLIDFAKLSATDGMKIVCIPLFQRLIVCFWSITLAATQHSGSTEAAAAAAAVV
jgi:hypothetical protein